MKNIIINGYSGCGKDSFIVELSRSISLFQWSIADWARSNVCALIEETDASAKKSDFVSDYRNTLIYLTNLGKRKGIVWRDLQESHTHAENACFDLFFIHCREPKDFVDIKNSIGDCITLWVSRDGIGPANEQDRLAKDYDYDFHINLVSNKSKVAWELQVKNFGKILIGKKG